MTRFFLAFWLMAFAGAPAVAQEVELTDEQLEEITQILRANLRADHVKWIEANVPLSADEGEKFWPLYRRYEVERTKLADQWLANVRDYAANYENLTEDKAKELLDRFFDIEKKRVELLEKHAKEMMKYLPVTVVARFVQVERRLNLLMDLETASQIPLVLAK